LKAITIIRPETLVLDNPLWGAPRIHGELLMLGFAVAQSSVAKDMIKRSGPSAQGWQTFLQNHGPNIAAIRDPPSSSELGGPPCPN